MTGAMAVSGALALGGFLAAGCSQGPNVPAAPAGAPTEILSISATAASQQIVGVATWRSYLGQNEVVTTGYDPSGGEVSSFSVTYDLASTTQSQVVLTMLDGTNTKIVATLGGDVVGAVTDAQRTFVANALLDIGAASQNDPGALSAENLSGGSTLAAVDVNSDVANCANTGKTKGVTAATGGAACVFAVAPSGGSLILKVLSWASRITTFGTPDSLPSCINGVKAMVDVMSACNGIGGCYTVGSPPMMSVVCYDAGAGKPEGGSKEGGAPGDAGGGKASEGGGSSTTTCDNTGSSATSP